MPLLTKKTVVFVKTETTQGTAIAVTATDALYCEASIEPVPERLERNYTRASLSPLATIVGRKSFKITIKTPLKGSGTPATIYAPLDALLLASGMTSTAGASIVTYARTSAPASANYYGPGKSCTVKAYLDGTEWVIAGAMGTCKISGEAGHPAMLEFSLQGIYAAPSDVAFPTATYLSAIEPIVQSSTLSVQSLSAIASKFEIDFGNTVVERLDTSSVNGIKGFMVTGWRGKGSLDPEYTVIATHNFIDKLMTGASGSLSFVVGSGSGAICTFTSAQIQYDNAKPSDRSGIRTLDLPFLMNGSAAGDDDFTIVIS